MNVHVVPSAAVDNSPGNGSRVRSARQVEEFDPVVESTSSATTTLGLIAGPHLRKSSFTFEAIDKDQNVASPTKRGQGNMMVTLKEATRQSSSGSPSKTPQTPRLSLEASPQKTFSPRGSARPSTAASTLSRITLRSMQDMIKPFGKVGKKGSACSEAEMDVHVVTQKPNTTPIIKTDSDGISTDQVDIRLLPGLEIVSNVAVAAPTRQTMTERGSSDESLDDTSHATPSSAHFDSTEPRVHPCQEEVQDRALLSSPRYNEGNMSFPASRSSCSLSSKLDPHRLNRRDSATREARMELAVNNLMGTGRRNSSIRQRSSETLQTTRCRTRTTSDAGGVTSTWSKNSRDSMISLEKYMRKPSIGRLPVIADTPPISPERTEKGKPHDQVWSPPIRQHEPVPSYTFPRQRRQEFNAPPDVLSRPNRALKTKRSGLVSFFKDKVLKTNSENGILRLGADGLSDAERIRATYLLTVSSSQHQKEEFDSAPLRPPPERFRTESASQIECASLPLRPLLPIRSASQLVSRPLAKAYALETMPMRTRNRSTTRAPVNVTAGQDPEQGQTLNVVKENKPAESSMNPPASLTRESRLPTRASLERFSLIDPVSTSSSIIATKSSDMLSDVHEGEESWTSFEEKRIRILEQEVSPKKSDAVQDTRVDELHDTLV